MSTSARESVPSPVSGVERTCQWCGSVIEDKRSNTTYCSPRCRRRAWAARHGTPVIAGGSGACLGCGELLTGRRSDAKWCSERCRMRARKEAGADLPYIWFWRQKPDWDRGTAPRVFDRDRKGERCRVLARGTMNSALVEFEDGYRVVTSRSGLRKAKR